MTDSTPVVLYATFTATAGNAAAVTALLKDYAVAVRREAGNVLFEASCKADEPESFFVYEEYADEAAFQAHLSAPYGASFNAALAPLIVEHQSKLTFLLRV
ncbi:MAG: antibiotic biosynthesis monooxygenase [Proteobacteria bacterium]|uniref:putative quinol monooxygenase n=1 Tax=Rudaea sp. TaxID=2136325 RepID=UPI0037835084|nr:antibiotic biosynthesis monooxygenase [Pseudomonadota bacterium]